MPVARLQRASIVPVAEDAEPEDAEPWVVCGAADDAADDGFHAAAARERHDRVDSRDAEAP